MTDMQRNYRRVSIDADLTNVVTIGIETEDGQTRAAVWWDSKTGVEAGEQQHLGVPEAFAAAHAALELNGFAEIVVVLQSDDLWDPQWGRLSDAARGPLENIGNVDPSDSEAFELASSFEAERDA